jgi:hypothetical protein
MQYEHVEELPKSLKARDDGGDRLFVLLCIGKFFHQVRQAIGVKNPDLTHGRIGRDEVDRKARLAASQRASIADAGSAKSPRQRRSLKVWEH